MFQTYELYLVSILKNNKIMAEFSINIELLLIYIDT
jgi:hypothetical protein